MRGFQYLNTGSKYTARLLVSIASLREFYPQERIAICTGDEAGYKHTIPIAREFDCSIVRWVLSLIHI